MTTLMKGHTWAKHKAKMTYPCYVEPKIDDIRCHVIVEVSGFTSEAWPVHFLSYAEKPLANMERFAPMWRAIAKNTSKYEFDCGFEVNGNFNDSYRWVRSTKALPEDLHEARCVFHLFDLPELAWKPYLDRRDAREETITYATYCVSGPARVQGMAWEVAHNAHEVELKYEKYRSMGFEGAMVKSLTHLYEHGKRSYGWLKMKPSEDADGVIVGFEEAVCGVDQPELNLKKGDLLERIGSVLLHCADGSQVAPHGIPHDLGRDMYRNPQKYLGETVEFKYMERDRQGGYRHPTFHRIREAQV